MSRLFNKCREHPNGTPLLGNGLATEGWLRPLRKSREASLAGADGHERSECEPDRAKQGRVVPEPNRDNWWISSSEPPRRGG